MRNIFYGSLILFLVLPEFTSAMIWIPSASVTIVETVTDGEDGTFDFEVLHQDGTIFSQAELVTTNGTTSTTISIGVRGENLFSLVQTVPQGWTLTGSNCTSDNSNSTFASIPNGILMNLGVSNITCTFTNIKSAGKNPVLIVPGIMGTNIFKNTELLWPDVARMLITPGDNFMDPLSFQNDGNPLDNSVKIGAVIDKASSLHYTDKLVSDLRAQGYIQNQTLFTFPYDWRKDISYVATQDDQNNPDISLKKQIDQLTLAGNKIDIVAHSQGGLVVKRLLYEKPEYKNKINKLIFVGVPNLGAPLAAKVLLYGDSMGVSFLGMGLDPAEVKKIGHNMPAVYELLPSQQYLSVHDKYLSQEVATYGDPNNQRPIYLEYDFSQTKQALKNQGLNASLLDQADNFHAAGYENLDFSNSGIKTFNIIGCQTGTPDKLYLPLHRDPVIKTTAGDGTVPVDSAKNIFGANTYYALSADHGSMLTQDGIRQEIETLLTGTNIDTLNKITQNAGDCHYNSTMVSVHSPVDLNIYDGQNNHLGPNPDGSFDAGIPDAQYFTFGSAKYAILPAGQSYIVKLSATDQGTFDFYSTIIKDGQTNSTAYYNQVPITATSTANINLNSNNNQTINFTSDSRIITPAAILDALQTQDLTPPISTSTISGLMGQPGYYRSGVSISLRAIDTAIGDGQPSNILKTVYSIDGGDYQTYANPVVVSAEGQHAFSFFSTDRAGNKEDEQVVNFTIDKTAPELIMQFDPSVQDLTFSATDSAPTLLASSTTSTSKKFNWHDFHPRPAVKILDNDSSITVTDAAGNTTELKFTDAGRKRELKADIKSLSYNGKPVDLKKTFLHFDWRLDKKGNLLALDQQVQSKKDFNILALLDSGKTRLIGKDQTGKINKLLNGLVLLKITTDQGDLDWSY